MAKREVILGPDAVAVTERLAEGKKYKTVSELVEATGLSERRVNAALSKLAKLELIKTRPALLKAITNESGAIVAFGRTPEGQLLYDLAMTTMKDKSIARKHRLKMATVRQLRELPSVRRLRRKALS